MKVGIIGLGLIGGSLGWALKRISAVDVIYGWDVSGINNKIALERGLVDQILDRELLIQYSDVIFLAVNMEVIESEACELLDEISPNQIVVDLGSTKRSVVASIDNHKFRSCFVAAHPIAGTEFSGPENALSNLFEGKQVFFCNVENSDPNKVMIIGELFSKIGMHVSTLGAYEHDLYIAYVSHLSHMISFSLASTVLEKEKMYDDITLMAGSGFASTVRLAKSSPKMWVPIVKHNKDFILASIEDFLYNMNTLKHNIEDEKWDELLSFFQRANQIKKLL